MRSAEVSELRLRDKNEAKVESFLLGSVPDGGLPPDASASEDERRARWLESWLVDYRFGTWEHCAYCGQPAGVSDHVIPHCFYSVQKRERGAGSAWGLKTPACLECNSLLGAFLFETLFERCKWLNRRLWKRYKRVLRLPRWDAEEIGELRYSLRTFVAGKQTERAVAMERVAWFESPEQKALVEQAVNEAAEMFPRNRQLIGFLGTGFC